MTQSTPENPKSERAANHLQILRDVGETAEQAITRTVLNPSITGADALRCFSQQMGALDLQSLVGSLDEQTKMVHGGDLGRLEAMLTTHAHTLDAIFNNLAIRSYGYMSTNTHHEAERCMRLALKAQGQCRATIESLGELKNPHQIAFVKQANISNGPQQVNNGIMPTDHDHARPEEKQIQRNELLDAKSYEQLDTRAPGTASAINPAVATVGAIDRATDVDR